MKKALLSIITVALLIVTMGLHVAPVHAESEKETYRMQDLAHLLTQEQVSSLQDRINALVDKYGMDLIIITEENMADYGYTDIVAFADDIYDEMEYGIGDDYSGMEFVIVMQEREWAISTCGKGIPAYTDATQDYIMSKVKPYLSSGDYYTAFSTLVDYAEQVMASYKEGTPYAPPKDPYNPGSGVIMFIIVGLVVSLIYTAHLKKQLKSVAFAPDANNYVDPNSLNINLSKDTFLYASVTKRAKPKSSSSGSSTHTSSSGRTHGGSHGSF